MITNIARIILAEIWRNTEKPNNEKPTISVVIPVYNESPFNVLQTLKSIERQTYQPLEVIVSQDGEENRRIKMVVENLGYKYICCSHKGKKFAQKRAMDKTEGEMIATIDSDTILDPNAFEEALKLFDKKTGAVCGQIKISNDKDGLNCIVKFLYWSSFNIWRLGANINGSVGVCSGAFTIYRKKVIMPLLKEHLAWKYNSGDDRRMTYLIMKSGYKTKCAHKAIAHTESPTGLKFWKQQTRWYRSFWQGVFYSWRIYGLKRWYFTIDILLRAFFRLALVGGFIWILFYLSRWRLEDILFAFFTAVFFGILFSAYGAIRTNNLKFMLFAWWGVISLIIIAPLNVYVLATITKDKWGTR